MAKASAAGALYALIVFLIGFILGTIRSCSSCHTSARPLSVSLEAPFLTASWFVYRWCVDRLDIPRRVGARSLMGAVAFVVLMTAEFALGRLMFGRPGAGQLTAYRSAAGAIRLAAQIVFAAFPLVQIWRRSTGSDRIVAEMGGAETRRDG
jgi:hypothetical protein